MDNDITKILTVVFRFSNYIISNICYYIYNCTNKST